MSELILERSSITPSVPAAEWAMSSESTYECRVVLYPEKEGGFSVHAVRLPGVVSQGETEAEALNNIADAFREVLQAYLESGQEVPWCTQEFDRSKGLQERWILVDV